MSSASQKSKRSIATVATSPEGAFPFFLKSASLIGGYEPKVWGYGLEWKGFKSKIQFNLDGLTRMKDDELVLLCDSFDLIITNPLDTLFDHFEAVERGVLPKQMLLISQEVDFTNVLKRIHFGSYDDIMLNTGSVLGRAKVLREMYAEIWETISRDPSYVADDQKLITDYLNAHRDTIKVITDDQQWFIVSPAGRSDIMGKLSYKAFADTKLMETNILSVSYKHENKKVQKPVLIHRPANGDLVYLLERLGYELSPEEKQSMSRPFYLIKQTMHHTKVFVQDKTQKIANFAETARKWAVSGW